jgi:RHS repeat-associated protein
MADSFRHRFSTKYYDAETGLYYYGYRFYAPN